MWAASRADEALEVAASGRLCVHFAALSEETPEESAQRLLREDRLDGVVFIGLDLQGAELGGKELTGCIFRQCKLQETLWRGSRLDDCRFEHCDLTRMAPRGMLAHDLRFAQSKLMGIEWTDLGQFPDLGFAECVLDFASFIGLGLRKTGFVDCKICEANFFDVDLREASFAGCDLRGSSFRGCQLNKTDFSAATSAYFDPAANTSAGARISMETAALIAMQLGLHVAGMTAPAHALPGPRAGATKTRSRARRP